MEEVSGKKLGGLKGAKGLLAGIPVTSGKQDQVLIVKR